MSETRLCYTLGHRESYERYFAEDDCPEKVGKEDGFSRGEPYTGGSIWLLKSQAARACKPGFAVYGVLVRDWRHGLEPMPGANDPAHFALLKHSLLILLDPLAIATIDQPGKGTQA